MKNIAILGSTGSIGTQTLDVVKANPDKLQVVAVAAHSNAKLLEEQINKFHPLVAALSDKDAAASLRKKYKGKTVILEGAEGLKTVATLPEADTVVGALVGYAGLAPILAAIHAKKHIALANKETLVAAGSIVMEAIKEAGVLLTPVDSEHSAIFQALQGNKQQEVKKLIITASGGAFRDKTLEELEHVTVAECLQHPNWSMGRKVTVDSATLANKGLEIMEAHWLFNIDYAKIEPVIHPQSIVHSLVEYKDGAVMAQLGLADMKLPIQYALSYPDRWDNAYGQLDLVKIGELTFKKIDEKIFKALKLAVDSGKAGGIMPCVFNAANEIAVENFLKGRIKYLDISRLIAEVLNHTNNTTNLTLDSIAEADSRARIEAIKMINRLF